MTKRGYCLAEDLLFELDPEDLTCAVNDGVTTCGECWWCRVRRFIVEADRAERPHGYAARADVSQSKEPS